MTLNSISVGALALSIALLGNCKKANDSEKPNAAQKTVKTDPSAKLKAKAGAGTEKMAKATKEPKAGKATKTTERGFAIHTRASAPTSTQAILDYFQKTFKFVPNLAAVMAESPALLNSYHGLQQNLQKIGSLSPPEDNIVQMSIAMENECQYCVAGHTMAGKVFFKSPDKQIEALRAKAKLPEAKLNALRDFALQVYNSKGRVSDKQLKTFFAAGYTKKQALDVVANVAAKVMSNFTNQMARTPLDEPLKPLAKGLPFAEDRKAIEAK